MAGLLGASACGDGKAKIEPDPVEPDAAVSDAPPDAATPTKIISETMVQHTFAELTAMCDARGGYIEIHASCSGSNTCAGFSYGDFGEEAVLTEHSCNAVSGCNGLGCVVLPPDGGRTPLSILEAALPDTEGVHARSCNYCHAKYDDVGFDATTFIVPLLPGSTRDITNWLDRSPDEQARIIAFGHHGVFNNAQYAAMGGYYKMYSRAEIERVVQYIRTEATIEFKTIKFADPSNKRRLDYDKLARARAAKRKQQAR
jgi:hypothetical protein